MKNTDIRLVHNTHYTIVATLLHGSWKVGIVHKGRKSLTQKDIDNVSMQMEHITLDTVRLNDSNTNYMTKLYQYFDSYDEAISHAWEAIEKMLEGKLISKRLGSVKHYSDEDYNAMITLDWYEFWKYMKENKWGA